MTQEIPEAPPEKPRVADYYDATDGGCLVQAKPCGLPDCRHFDGRLAQSCTVIDCAITGERTLEAVAAFFGVTRERIRQIEVKGLQRFARRLPREVRDQYLGDCARLILRQTGGCQTPRRY